MDLKKRNMNLIVTGVILLAAALIGLFTGIKIANFRSYETQFVIRDNIVDKVIKFHEYSKNLEGTIGDSEIYEINGTENTVLVIRKEDSVKFTSLTDVKNANISAVESSNALAKASEVLDNIVTVSDINVLFNKLSDKTIDGAILSYEQAKTFITNIDFMISDIEIEKVPSILIIGGTHPNEPSGQLTATLFLENALVERGKLFIVTELNKSAYTHSQPQEATTWFYHLTTATGATRTFKFGSRATNSVDQWPTPDVYTHSSGQQLSSSEVRNINRAYPGSETGTYTEQVAYAITNFVNKNNITMVIDLHEASPEYLTINACVYHQDSSSVINKARSKFFKYVDENDETAKIGISYDQSPENMHGLTHRELGDYTSAYVFLFETSNASQGKLRGPFTEDLITYYKNDKFYEAAVAYDKKHQNEENYNPIIYGRPVTIDERVARHALSITSVIGGYNLIGETRTVNTTKINNSGTGGEAIGEFILNNIPEYTNIIKNGIGYYLLDVE